LRKAVVLINQSTTWPWLLLVDYHHC